MKKTKADLIASINRDLADNATQEITPRDVRSNLIDVIDSTANFLTTEEIVSTNFSTPEARTTIAGEYALSRIGQESYTSEDNSAFGYAALKQNFQGSKNTAVGCFSLNCNVYGTDNVAVGYESIAGNSNGVGNVGIGNYSLYYNKLGNMNVAIGHGAGYYADREASQKLYIGVHPVTEQYVCDNPEGEGLTPLVHGDFQLRQFGINVNSFHPYGTVQVSGGISPSEDAMFSLGHSDYAFSDINTRSVTFWEGNGFSYDPDKDIVIVSGVQTHADDIKPMTNNVYSLGSPSQKWRHTHTNDLTVDGTATINELKAVTSCLYDCKTLYLATSGVCEGEVNPCGYLNESELNGAGLIIPTSGDAGLADYKWIMTASGLSVQNIVPGTATLEDKAYWTSNNNVLLSGDHSHIRAAKYLSQDDGTAAFGGMIGNTGNGFGGMNVAEDATYQRVVFTTNDGFDDANFRSLDKAGDGDFASFYSAYTFSINSEAEDTSSRSVKSRRLTVNTPDIDVPVSINLNHGTAHKRGVEFYSTSSGVAPGLYIQTHEGGSDNRDINTVSIMQSDNTGGVLGVSDFDNQGQVKIPETIINARSKADASIRVTAENAGDVKSAIELCGELNCLKDAAEFAYTKTDGLATISTYIDSGKKVHTSFDSNDGNTIFNNGLVQVGEADASGIISIRNHPEDHIVDGMPNFTRLYSREVDKLDQSSELIYVDSDGNSWPLSLVTSLLDPVSWDSNLNLFGGSGTPYDRAALTTASGNTTFGNYALADMSNDTGSEGNLNTIVGFAAGSGILAGDGNTIIGAENISTQTTALQNNVILGNNNNIADNQIDNILIGNNIYVEKSHNIVLGNRVSASGLSDHSLLVASDDQVLMSGSMPNHYVSMPDGGAVVLHGTDNETSTTFRDHGFTVKGSGDRYGVDNFDFTFEGDSGLSNHVIRLNHSAHYSMSNTETYESVNPRRPYLHVNGDAQVRGSVRFSDGTSLDSASAITDIATQLAAMQELIDTQTIEGTMLDNVYSPSTPLTPTQGIMTRLDGTTAIITLRDIYLRLEEGDYVVANRVMNTEGEYEYRPVWVSNENSTCGCGRLESEDYDGGQP